MKTPKLAKDLGRDLRDKNLLPVVGVLLLAIVAVPLLLGGGSEPEPGPAVAGSAAIEVEGEDSIAQPVVLAEVPGIRDYEKRLDAFNKRNPFKQQYASQSKAADESLDSVERSTAQLSSGGGSSEPAEDSGSGSGSGGSSKGSGGGSGGNGGSGGGGSGGGGGGGDKVVVYSWEIDVKVTVDGSSEEKKGVKQLEFVPGKERPVLQFIQGDFDESFAVFVVSRAVDRTRGEGDCSPNDANCEFVLLERGQAHHFVYEPDGRSYRIKLNRVRLIEERIDPDKLSPDELTRRIAASSGLLESLGR